jgi:hypothetical protein
VRRFDHVVESEKLVLVQQTGIASDPSSLNQSS